MADLHETLEKRERRSRLVSFLVGSAIILAIIVGVVWFNNRNDNGGEVVDDGVNITATEDGEDSDAGADDNNQSDDSSDADSSTADGDNDSGDSATDSNSAADDSASDNDGEVSTDSDDETDGEASDETDSEDQQTVATTGGGDDSGELPNTGPEHAVIGLIAVAITARLFVKTRENLDSKLQS